MFTPNIFRHAQREMHQDALVAYLFDWLRADAPDSLRRVAKRVVAGLTGIEIDRVIEAKTQWNMLDVFARARSQEGRPLVIVVENKTSTTEHGGQLLRYRTLAEQAFPDHQFVGIYLKTGWVEPRDQQACETAGYRLVDRPTWLELLSLHCGVDPVLDQYLDVLEEKDRWFLQQLQGLENLATVNEALWHLHVQWSLASRMFPDAGDSLYWGTNRGGTSWVQRRIAKFQGPGGAEGSLFWRFNHRSPQRGSDSTAYVALRAWEKFDRDNPAARATRLERLARFRQLFGQAFDACVAQGCPLVPGKLRSDERAPYEAEVASFFVDANSVNDLVEWIPQVSERFVALAGPLTR